MIDTIAPGSRITLTVTKKPTSVAATKTVVRLLCKDKTVMAEDARLKKARQANTTQHQRGGRRWTTKVVKQPAVQALPGVSKTITASLDVLTDLKSIARFVEVKLA